MTEKLRDILVPATMVLGLSAAVFTGMLILTRGEFVYPLDDSYIHISLAKTLAESGTWGLAPGEWAFCSSSPLWTLLLALPFRIFGIIEWLPFLLSVLCNIGAAITAWRFFGNSSIVKLLVLLLVTPFAITGALGMEHALHMWLTLWTIAWFATDRRSWEIIPVAFLSVATRYESLFLLTPIACVVFFERRRFLSLAILVMSAAPAGLYGWYAVAHGGPFFPVSLLFKGGGLSVAEVFSGISGIITQTSAGNIHMRFLMAAMLITVFMRKVPTGIRKAAAVIFVAIGGHLVFAKTGWLYRYEAYLVAASAVICLTAFAYLPRKTAIILFISPALAFLALRGAYASYRAITAPRDIQSQQVAMAKMFSALPPSKQGPVAVNDIGYISLHAGVPVLDLWGLGSGDVAELKIKNKLDKAAITKLFDQHGIRYAAVFDTWFPREILPDDLELIDILHTPGNRTCGDDKVHIYERKGFIQ